MKEKKESFFWTSYSDLMTSLFFVMLVLFVLALVLVHSKMVALEDAKKEAEKIANATQEQLAKIEELNTSIERIDENYFEYDSEYKRHTLKNISVSFRARSSNIYDIPISDRERLLEAGNAIIRFMRTAMDSIPEARYLLIVEGQSSRDNYSRNDELSYERALALVKFWKAGGVSFEGLPCELIISGSGCNSSFRIQPDIPGNSNNQRFVIHIIPKPGIIGK